MRVVDARLRAQVGRSYDGRIAEPCYHKSRVFFTKKLNRLQYLENLPQNLN